jgi:uncharacterized protein (TIGR02300 family)
MGRPELGTKLACRGCGERFYDLNRSPAICPKCGAEQPPDKPRAPARTSENWRGRRQPVPAVAEADDADAVAAPDAEEDEDAAEADPDIEEVDGDPDIDIAEVKPFEEGA